MRDFCLNRTAPRFDPAQVYGFGVATTTILTLVTPVAAPVFPALIFVRIVEGLGEVRRAAAMLP